MDDIKLEYEHKNEQKQKYLRDLKEIIVESNTPLEGNCFYYHESLNPFPELYSKQINLFWCGKQAATNLCEIGFNAGHSAMLLLLGRDRTPLRFTIFDLGHHAYTQPCVEYIQSKFKCVQCEYVEGDSTVVMPKWIKKHTELIGKYDVVHVDGGHTEHCIENDMKNADILVAVQGILIVDDTNQPQINKYVDQYLSTGKYVEIPLLPSYGYPHRIIKKIKSE